MKRFLSTAFSLVASAVVLVLAAGLFVPRKNLPAWFREQVAVSQPPPRADSASSEAKPPANPQAKSPAPPTLASSQDSSTKTLSPSRHAPKIRPETNDELLNCYFTPLPDHPSTTPRAVDVPLPRYPGRSAVWGGTGRDVQGRIWIGACAEGLEQNSARLFCYDTKTGELIDAGDVVSALRAAGILREGESQAKIHSKIIQAADGHLYFASMDERGENSDGSRLPTFGGHLWRLRLPERKWEHLHASPEALIAVAGAGRYIYALGYFNHVLTKFDTETGLISTITVGSVDGHISRNFLADLRGHVFVPRLTRGADSTQVRATLVEFDESLTELGQTDLEYYLYGLYGNPTDSHGITGVQPLADGSIAFVTHGGRLYRVTPGDQTVAEVKDLGWMHPLGEMEIESLFTIDGASWLLAAAHIPVNNFEWVSFDLNSSTSKTTSLDIPLRYAGVNRGLLLYGSMTRDAEGAFYLVGTSQEMEPRGPLVCRMMPPR